MNGFLKVFKDKLLITTFLSNLFYSVAFPSINYFLIKEVGQRFVTIRAMFLCLAGIVIPILWNKYSDRLYKKLGYLFALESILYSILVILILIDILSPKIYYILDTLVLALITKNIMCGGNKLKSLRYEGVAREEFDNNVKVFINFSGLLGFGIGAIFMFSMHISFVLGAIGICFDNIFYYLAYKE